MKIEDKMADDVQDTEMTEDVDFVPEYHNESCCLSITNVPSTVFENQDLKVEFNQLFLAFDEAATVSYFKSFRRVRVTFSSSELASEAKLVLHGCKYRGTELGVYFVQSNPCSSSGESSQLKPPPLTKQFLISPPPSPPVGWEQTHEASPIINYDLLTAVAALDKSEPYELHPPDTDAPSIVVHLCDEEEEVEVMDEDGEKPFHPLKCLPREAVQTRRPNNYS
ncbi:calcipressin-2-like [Actinia tenebrosa]|uniref:Calcipressin-2-like n=1 Tax=Actinia tenebrosa TaxID=6105 RepID=A0A6P8I4D3_ACTTE|nr:calcipressin-2-like [Actinia tenebrosa]